MQTARHKIEGLTPVPDLKLWLLFKRIIIERMEIDFASEWNEEDSVESCKFVCVCVCVCVCERVI